MPANKFKKEKSVSVDLESTSCTKIIFYSGVVDDFVLKD